MIDSNFSISDTNYSCSDSVGTGILNCFTLFQDVLGSCCPLTVFNALLGSSGNPMGID